MMMNRLYLQTSRRLATATMMTRRGYTTASLSSVITHTLPSAAVPCPSPADKQLQCRWMASKKGKGKKGGGNNNSNKGGKKKGPTKFEPIWSPGDVEYADNDSDDEMAEDFKDYNDFEGSNFVGIADRLILRSKKDQTIIDSQGDITLNTPNKVMIGSDATRMTGIPQGEQLLNVLRDIAAILKSGHIVEGSISRAVKKDKLKKLSGNIEKILSTKYSIEKN